MILPLRRPIVKHSTNAYRNIKLTTIKIYIGSMTTLHWKSWGIPTEISTVDSQKSLTRNFVSSGFLLVMGFSDKECKPLWWMSLSQKKASISYSMQSSRSDSVLLWIRTHIRSPYLLVAVSCMMNKRWRDSIPKSKLITITLKSMSSQQVMKKRKNFNHPWFQMSLRL